MQINLQNLAEAISPAKYLERLGLDPFDWQEEVLNPDLRRVLMLCAMQTGKSTIVACKALNKAKHFPGALILVLSPSQDKSKEIMKKIEAMMVLDKQRPDLRYDSVFEKEFYNGSRIIALPGTEKSVRGYSGPKMIIVDEAARVLDETYRAARPMMVMADTELIALTTAYGKRGFFWNAWTEGKHWRKVFVRVSWDLKEGKYFVPAAPIEEARAYWRERGVSLYYSTRHDTEFLQEEYEEGGGELWIRQEYLCEFLNVTGGIFSDEDWEDSVDHDLEPLFEDDAMIDDDIPILFGGE